MSIRYRITKCYGGDYEEEPFYVEALMAQVETREDGPDVYKMTAHEPWKDWCIRNRHEDEPVPPQVDNVL